MDSYRRQITRGVVTDAANYERLIVTDMRIGDYSQVAESYLAYSSNKSLEDIAEDPLLWHIGGVMHGLAEVEALRIGLTSRGMDGVFQQGNYLFGTAGDYVLVSENLEDHPSWEQTLSQLVFIHDILNGQEYGKDVFPWGEGLFLYTVGEELEEKASMILASAAGRSYVVLRDKPGLASLRDTLQNILENALPANIDHILELYGEPGHGIPPEKSYSWDRVDPLNEWPSLQEFPADVGKADSLFSEVAKDFDVMNEDFQLDWGRSRDWKSVVTEQITSYCFDKGYVVTKDVIHYPIHPKDLKKAILKDQTPPLQSGSVSVSFLGVVLDLPNQVQEDIDEESLYHQDPD